MRLFGPKPVPLTCPQPTEMSLPALSLVKKKHMEAVTDLKRTVEQVLFDHKEQYAPSAVKIVRTVGTRARLSFGMYPYDLADVDEETRVEYLTAAALGLAAGQTEVALSLAPGPRKTHAYMDMVLRMSATGFEDAVCGYLVRAGHYVARERLAWDPGVGRRARLREPSSGAATRAGGGTSTSSVGYPTRGRLDCV